MLSPIDEGAEDTMGRLDTISKPECPKSIPEVVGGHGPWQLRHWLAFLGASFCASLHLFAVYPFSSAVDCSCRNHSVIFSKETFNSDTSAALQQQVIAGNKTCFYGAFLHTEQDAMNCSNVGLVIYAKCIYFIGILLSGLTVHLITFKFGKRCTSLGSGLFLLVSAFAVGWAQNVAAYLVLRLVIGFGMTNVYLLSISSLKEFVGEDYILVYGLIGHIGWSLAHLILPLAAWLAGDWLSFSIYTAGVSFLLFILLCFIPESVEAYLSKGLSARAHKVIRKAAWANGYHTQDVEYFTRSLHHQKSQEDLKLICKQVDFRRYFELFLRFLIGFSAAFLYFVTIWLTDWRRVDRGGYYALAGTTEVASTLVLLFLTCFLSLKHLWSAATVMTSVSLLLMYAKSSDESPIPTPPYLFTMFFSSAACTLVLLKTLFHPLSDSASKWNAAVSGVALCVGALAASLNDLQKFHDWNPKLLVIFGIPNLTIGSSIAVVPERYFTF